MSLFTDAEIVTLDDLLQFENTLSQVSATHSIDVTKKIGLAVDSVGDKILLCLLRAGQIGNPSISQGSTALDRVVVTPAIYKWLCLESMAGVFAEAYSLQLNTRFQAKLIDYRTQADLASEIVFASGIGMVDSALPKPGLPICTVDVGTMTAQGLFVQTAWTDASGQEGALSPVSALILNGFAEVRIAIVNQIRRTPPAALGWNVYISETQGSARRQNAMTIAPTDTWVMPQTGVVQGALPTGGQAVERVVLTTRRWLRG